MNFLYAIRLKRKAFERSLRTKQENLAVRKAFASDSEASFIVDKIKEFKKTIYIAASLIICFAFIWIVTVNRSLQVDMQEKEKKIVIITKVTPIITATKPGEKISEHVIEKMPITSIKREERAANIFNIKQEYVLLMNKKTRNLLLLKNHEKTVELVEQFTVSVGKSSGDKQFEGDLKTPEGMYKIIKIKQKKELSKIFGPIAFVLNYPNKLDKKSGKTGSNIWIHGTGLGMDKLTPDTKGCVEVSDQDIIRLSKYIGVETEIVIFSENHNILNDFENKHMSKARIKEILVDEAKI